MAPTPIHRHRIRPLSHEATSYRKFVKPPAEPPRTLDPARAAVVRQLELIQTHDMPLPFRRSGSDKLRMWVIQERGRPARFPSPLLRLTQGELFNARVISSGGPHTIHWHGIEPSPMNDGVGKHSFEISDAYTYQWVARHPGFYFYHCHVNTPLHFDMGLFGPLVIDPPAGPGWVAAMNPPDHVVRYDVEAIFICSAHNSRWRGLEHGHALNISTDPNDPLSFTANGRLHDWRPDVFAINGVVPRQATTVIADPRVAVSARVGQTVLLRILNASYSIQEFRIGADVQVIAQDGRPYGVPPYGSYSQPFTIPAGRPFQLTGAMRHDMLMRPVRTGTIPFSVRYLDWRGYGTQGEARTAVTVSA